MRAIELELLPDRLGVARLGAVWEIYNQLESWSAMAELEPFRTTSDTVGRFVIDIAGKSRPAPMESGRTPAGWITFSRVSVS